MIRSYRQLDMQQLEVLNLRLENIDTDPVLPGEGRVWFNSVSKYAKIRANGLNRLLFAPDDDFNTLAYKTTLHINDTLLIYDIEHSQYRRIKASVIIGDTSSIKNSFGKILTDTGVAVIADGDDTVSFLGDGVLLESVGNALGSRSVTYSLKTQNQYEFLAGPVNANTGKPFFRRISDGDMPESYSPTQWTNSSNHASITTGNPHHVTMEDLGFVVVNVVGDPGTDTNIPTEKAVRDSLVAVVGSIIYTNATPMPQAVGGYPINTTFLNQTMQNMWDGLLYVYQVPYFASFSFNAPSTVMEAGDIIPSGDKTFSWSTANSGNITAGTIKITDVTAATDLVINSVNDGTELINFGSAITKTVTGQVNTWRITGTSNKNVDFTRDYTVIWHSPMYFGTGAPGLSVASLQDLTKVFPGRVSQSPLFTTVNNKIYFAYPKSYGLLSSIKDVNLFVYTGDFTVTTQSFTTNAPNYKGVATDYYVYEFNNLTNLTNYQMFFNF